MNKFLISVLGIVAIGSAAYFYFNSSGTLSWQSATSTSTPVHTDELAPLKREVPQGTKEYQSGAYRFSLLYPDTLSVKETLEGGGAMTITFQNIDTAEGFQIFVVPYGEAQVSETRFKQDIPSGVRKNLTTISVDGALGAAFYSRDTLLGDTREVWFIKNGYLFEMTTLKSLNTWLDSIIQTWKFF